MSLTLDERERLAFITNTPLIASADEIERADELDDEVDCLKAEIRGLEEEIANNRRTDE